MSTSDKRAAERALLRRLKAEMPDVYARWWAEVYSTSPPRAEVPVTDLLGALERSLVEAKDAAKRHNLRAEIPSDDLR